ncbi:hypothetical protein L1987_38311 [Smallanthus sonchifolius]|uniref:Uncharacterized protein n=1 Tax=Smallanthus sonchifolius TaxID=185202 RepID=A0ACB9HIA8_9ASTR|nr:hypothetical protein L1987_38311 [Smallanthus sonchifolius]
MQWFFGRSDRCSTDLESVRAILHGYGSGGQVPFVSRSQADIPPTTYLAAVEQKHSSLKSPLLISEFEDGRELTEKLELKDKGAAYMFSLLWCAL